MKSAKRDYSERIKKRFPDFEKEWEGLIREVGTGLVNFLKEKITVEYAFLKELTAFKFKLIVDNNFIFGQIKGSIKKNKNIEESLLYKLLISKSVEIFAPPKLGEELNQKIKELLDANDQELGLKYAMLLLPKITIKDAQWVDDWKKANKIIGEFDSDDVPYLALAFEVGGHAILSFDHVFHKQGDIQVWKHKETDKIVTNYNSGFISLCIMGKAGELLAKLIAVIFKFIRDSILKLVHLLVKMARGIVKGIASIPPEILIALVTLGIVFYDDIKNAGKDLFKLLVEKGNEVITKLKAAIKEIMEIIQKILGIAELGATITFEFLGFLLDEYNGLNEQLQGLKIPEVENNFSRYKIPPEN